MAKTEEKEVAVSRIELKLGDKTVRLTVAEAEKLYNALAHLFARETIRVEREFVYIPRPIIYEWNQPATPWWRPTWTCSDNQSSNAVLSLEVK